MIGLFKQRYGASPLHLLAHAAAFAIAVFALDQILAGGSQINFIVWFGGAAILHDVVFVPLYSLLDRVAHSRVGRAGSAGTVRLDGASGASATPAAAGAATGPGAGPDIVRRVPVVNYIRTPGLISGLLLLVYFPVIFGPGDKTYFAATGHHLHGYVRNWLLITAGLFLGSALVYAVRLRGASGGGPNSRPDVSGGVPDSPPHS